MPVPYTFGTATASIPLSQLDSNFATAITIGNTAVQLGNTVTTLNNMTLANVTISSGNVTITNVSVTTANVSGTANVQTLAVTQNATVAGNVTVTGNVSMNVATITTSNVTTENVSSLIVTGNQTFVGTGNRITGDFSNATTTSRVSFQSSTTNGATVVQLIPNGTSTSAQFSAYGGSDILNTSVAQLTNNGTEVRIASGIFGTGTYLPMTFYTGGSERMRVDTSGNVGIGTSSPGNRLHISGATNATSGVSIQSTGASGRRYTNYSGSAGGLAWFDDTASAERMRIDSSGNLLVGTTSLLANASYFAYSPGNTWGVFAHDNGVASGIDYVKFYYNNGQIGSISQNGTTGVLYNITSDYRLKTVTGPVTSAGSRIDALEPVEYTWKSDGSVARGFLAHQFQEVYPNSVTGEKDAVDADGKPVYQNMQASTSEVIADLVAEIKSLRHRVAQLEGA